MLFRCFLIRLHLTCSTDVISGSGLNTLCVSRAPSQYPIRRLSVRSRKVSKPRDLYLELSDRSEIWQALRQHGCRCACQISKRCNSLKYQSRDFETSRDLTKRRLFVYWDGAQTAIWSMLLFMGFVGHLAAGTLSSELRSRMPGFMEFTCIYKWTVQQIRLH